MSASPSARPWPNSRRDLTCCCPFLHFPWQKRDLDLSFFLPYSSISRPDANHTNAVKILFLPVDPLYILVPAILGIFNLFFFLKIFWQIPSPTDDCFGADFPVHLELVEVSCWSFRKLSLCIFSLLVLQVHPSHVTP